MIGSQRYARKCNIPEIRRALQRPYEPSKVTRTNIAVNTPQLPAIELLQGAPAPESAGRIGWRRWQVFCTVLLIALVVGLAVVYGRTPVFRASASVLTVKPAAVDEASADADVEHVAIQSRLLLGEDLLGRLARRLNDGDGAAGPDPTQLREMLSIAPVPDTNLLELRADGAEPEQLKRVVNLWAECFEELRQDEIETATGRTTSELNDKLAELSTKIESTRAELLAFRESHNIISLERTENRSLSSLKGLNDSLNKARENLITAEAKKRAVDEAIAKGETVVPREQKSDIAKLKLEVERTRSRLIDLKSKYTQAYIDRDPDLAGLPDTLSEMEKELARAIELARTTVSDEAQQELEAARTSVAALEQKLDEQQQSVQQFTEHFKEFKVMEENLARLETMQADTAARIAEIQVRNQKKFPPIQIVEWAREPTTPVSPNYTRDLMIALAGALGLALFATWLFDYLTERSRTASAPPYFGVRIYPGNQPQNLGGPAADYRLAHAELIQESLPRAAPTSATPIQSPLLPRELSREEIALLFAHADEATAGNMLLLLAGISPFELSLLEPGCFDQVNHRVTVPGQVVRTVEIDAATWPRIADWYEGKMNLPLAELDLCLTRTARAAGLTEVSSINALALWHSYVVYLVRRGIDEEALCRRVGNIPPEVLRALREFAPPGGTRELDAAELIYPPPTEEPNRET